MTTTRTLTGTITRRLAAGVVFFGIAAQAIVWGSADAPEYDAGVPDSTQAQAVMDSRPHAKGSTADLIVRAERRYAECWDSGQGHPLPTVVIVTMRDEVAPRITQDPTIVSAAYDNAVAGKPLPRSIFAYSTFCA